MALREINKSSNEHADNGTECRSLQLTLSPALQCTDEVHEFVMFPPENALARASKLNNCWSTSRGHGRDQEVAVALTDGHHRCPTHAVLLGIGAIDPPNFGFTNPCAELLAFGSCRRAEIVETRADPCYRADAPLYLKTYRKRYALVAKHFARPGRVLDVGCAAGYFLKVCQEKGWDVLGLEVSDAIRPQAEERLGKQHVMAGLLEDAPLAPASFDLVTFWDVVEHIPDVVGALKHVRTLLKPGGKLLIETQNVASRTAARMGKAWNHYKHAEHIYHFDPKTIADVLGCDIDALFTGGRA
jgi:hypothetical protein